MRGDQDVSVFRMPKYGFLGLVTHIWAMGIRKTLTYWSPLTQFQILFNLLYSFNTQGKRLKYLEIFISYTFHDTVEVYENTAFCFTIACK